MSSDNSLFPSLNDPIGDMLKEKNLPEGVGHLLRLWISLNSTFTTLGVSPSSDLKNEIDWLRIAVNKILDDDEPPIKALELQVGQGRRGHSKDQVYAEWGLVEQVERIRHTEKASQSDAIAKVAGKTFFEGSIKGRYFRALPSYKNDQKRRAKIEEFRELLKDPDIREEFRKDWESREKNTSK